MSALLNSTPRTLYSIGHSTRSLDAFLELLREHAVGRLADIRRHPGSRRYPQFSRESLAAGLGSCGIDYVHLEALGGRRRPRPGSPNTFWHNEQFRGYADHMASGEFRLGVDALLASEKPTAFLCAEAVPWRCHRNLLSDELLRRGHEVVHILGPGAIQRHIMHAAARDGGGFVVYPASLQQVLDFGEL